MADVLLVHVPEDQALARGMADTLMRSGLTVTRDPADEAEAACVLVLWSPASIRSGPVRDLAIHAQRESRLVTAKTAGCEAPLGFSKPAPHDLSAWAGDSNDPQLDPMFFAVDRLVCAARLARQKISNAPVPAPLIRAPALAPAQAPALAFAGAGAPAPTALQPQAPTPPPAPITPPRPEPVRPPPPPPAWVAKPRPAPGIDEIPPGPLARARKPAPGAPKPVLKPPPKPVAAPPAPAPVVAAPAPPPAPEPEAAAPIPEPAPAPEAVAPAPAPVPEPEAAAPAPEAASPASAPAAAKLDGEADDRIEPVLEDLAPPPPAKRFALERLAWRPITIVGLIVLCGLMIYKLLPPPLPTVTAAPVETPAEGNIADLPPETASPSLATAIPSVNPALAPPRSESRRPPPPPAFELPPLPPAIEFRALPLPSTAAPAPTVSATPEAPSASPTVSTAPPSGADSGQILWTRRPSARDMADNYPPTAQDRNLPGQATLDCQVRPSRTLSCALISESPANQGFGRAALRIADKFQTAPTMTGGGDPIGKRLRLPVRFTPPGAR